MEIHGFQKTTLLDYPGHIAATIFFGGCNFRCPFCHNGDLVINPASVPTISEEKIFSTLRKRQGILDGVCITGGEPTLQKNLEIFIRKIRDLGYSIKLDTNGYRPDVLKHLCEEKLIDYVAMDIKHCPDKYNMIANVANFSIKSIMESVSFLVEGGLPYEFRTTVIREYHKQEDFDAIAKWLSGASRYYLQAYKDSEQVISPGFHSYSKEELEAFLPMLQQTIDSVEIRGLDA